MDYIKFLKSYFKKEKIYNLAIIKKKNKDKKNNNKDKKKNNNKDRNKYYQAYLATEFIFTLIIFSILIYTFSIFVRNVACVERKFKDRDDLDYILSKVIVEEKVFLKNYKLDKDSLTLDENKDMDDSEIKIIRRFKDKKFDWIESEIRVNKKGITKIVKLHSIMGVD